MKRTPVMVKREGSPTKLASSRATSKTRQQKTGPTAELPLKNRELLLSTLLADVPAVPVTLTRRTRLTTVSTLFNCITEWLAGNSSLYFVWIKQLLLVTLIALIAWLRALLVHQLFTKYHFIATTAQLLFDMYCSICVIYYPACT